MNKISCILLVTFCLIITSYHLLMTKINKMIFYDCDYSLF